MNRLRKTISRMFNLVIRSVPPGVLVACTATLLLAAPTDAAEPTTPIAVGQATLDQVWIPGSIYFQLKKAERVYICTVSKTTTVRTPAFAEEKFGTSFLQFGTVSLAVSKTLAGENRASITLPLSKKTKFLKGAPYGPWPWPDDAFSKPRWPLCMVVGAAPPDAAFLGRRVDGVASRVFIGKDDDDNFEWMADLCRLSKFGPDDPLRRLAALRQAATDANTEVRKYAVDALVYEFLLTSTDVVVDAIAEQFGRCEKLGTLKTGETATVLRGFERVSDDADAVLPARFAALRVLAHCIAVAPDAESCGLAVDELALAVTDRPVSTPIGSVGTAGSAVIIGKRSPSAKRSLSKQEKSNALRALEQITPEKRQEEAVETVKRWLGS